MNDVFRQHRAARRDLIEHFRFIARAGGMRAARRFLDRSEATFRRLASRPNAGAPFDTGDPRFAGLRYSAVSGFKNHIVFYRPAPDGIEVLRVLHGSRDLEGPLASTFDDEGDEEEVPEAG